MRSRIEAVGPARPMGAPGDSRQIAQAVDTGMLAMTNTNNDHGIPRNDD